MQALNEHCFSEPHWRVIAQGFDTEAWFEDNQGSGTGGIFNPTPRNLNIGHRYYRFASSTSAPASQAGGGWWIEFETFNTIRHFAERNGYSVSDAARLFLALPYDWTRVDRLVSAFLDQPLKAYSGKGKPANAGAKDPRDKGSKWVPVQHIQVEQLYIPGLYSRSLPADSSEQVYKRAFPKPEVEYIHGNRKSL